VARTSSYAAKEARWTAFFVLLPLLIISALATLRRWHWSGASSPVTATHESVVRQHETQRAPAVPSPASAAKAGSDAGLPVGLSLRTLQSMFDASKLLKRNAAEAAANLERYCAETAKLPKHVFADRSDAGPLRDAAYFLEPLVTWETHPPIIGILQLPQPLIDKIRATHDDWATMLSPADATGLDFGWMAQLLNYDYWSLATVGPVADQAATVDPFYSPIPSYQTFVHYAKLRYVRALAQGDVAEAMKEVQHLADLLHSNGILIAEIHAAKLVSLGQQLEMAATQQGYSPMAPPPLDSAGYDQFHDLTLAGIAFMMPGVDDATLKRAVECVPDPCVAINDAVAQHREMERLSEQEDDGAFRSLARSLTCDSSLMRLIEGSPSSNLDALAGYLSGEPLPLEKLFGPEIAANLPK
jgi:hypothetical protein